MFSLVQSIQLWDLLHKKDLYLLKKVQRKAMKRIRGMEHISYEAVRAGAVQHGEEKAQKTLWHLTVPEGDQQKSREKTFYKSVW